MSDWLGAMGKTFILSISVEKLSCRSNDHLHQAGQDVTPESAPLWVLKRLVEVRDNPSELSLMSQL